MSVVTIRDKAIAWGTSARHRRWTYLVLAIVFAILSLFPQPYLARARLMPQDTANAAGISGLMNLLGGQSQSVASLLGGGKVSNDLYLIIGRSDAVASRVVRDLKMVGPNGFADEAAAKRYLGRKIEVTLLLAGVMQIEAKTWDAEESKRLTSAYVSALSKELAEFGEQLIVNKQRIIDRRSRTAQARLVEAEAAMNAFRRANNLAAPEQQLGTELALRTGLQAQLQAKQVELQTLRQFNGPENPALKALETQIASLQSQLAKTAAPKVTITGPNLAGSGELTSQYLNLYRDYRLAQAIYEVYSRSQEQIALDQLAAETASYVQIIDPAFIEIHRQINVWAAALLALVVLAAAFTELYGPLTGLFDLDRRKRAELEA
jgi:hypothetical protein